MHHNTVLDDSGVWQSPLSARYDDVAPTWHQVVTKLGYDSAYRAVFEQLKAGNSSIDKRKKTLSVLDIGIGSGSLTEALLSTDTDTAWSLHGVDISRAMLTQARATVAGYGYRLRTKRASVTTLPYEDNQFDMVMSAHVLEHLDTPLQGIQEMTRILKPTGKLLLICTRQGIWGQWIRHKWGIHPVTKHMLQTALSHHGIVNSRFVPVGHLWHRWASLAIIGTKP
ncbi:MAG: class I SAM-dependent methyltransferase [Chloroflexota bacterium]